MPSMGHYTVKVVYRNDKGELMAAGFNAEGSRPAVAISRAIQYAERYDRGRRRGRNLIIGAAIEIGPPGFKAVRETELPS